MATDQDIAAQILARQQAQAAGVPESLQANPPEAFTQALPPEQAAAVAANPAMQDPVAIWDYNPKSDSVLGKAAEYVGAYGVRPAVQGVQDVGNAIADAGSAIVGGAKDIGTGFLQGAAPELAAKMEAQKQQEAQDVAAAAMAQAAQAQQQAAATPAPAPVEVPPPTEEQRQAAHKNITEPAQQAMANHDAVQAVQSDLQQRMFDEQEKLQKQAEAIQAQINKADDSVRMRSLPEIMATGSFGDKLGISLAMALGAIGQGMTGAKSNPVMDFIDKQVAAQAEKDKLSAEQKLALKKQLLEVSQQKLEGLKAASQDQYHKDSIAVEQQKVAVEHEKVVAAQKIKAQEAAQAANIKLAKQSIYEGKEVTPEIRQNLSENEMNSLVQVAGKTYLSNSPDAAKEFMKNYGPSSRALITLKKYQPLIEKGIWRTLGEKGVMAALKSRAEAKTMEQAIIGALRLPYTGPGALNQGEREGLLNNIGKYGLWNLPSVEAQKINFIIKDLESRNQWEAEQAGLKGVQVNPRQYVKLDNNRMVEREEYIQQKAAESGLSVEKVAEKLKEEELRRKQGR